MQNLWKLVTVQQLWMREDMSRDETRWICVRGADRWRFGERSTWQVWWHT